MDQSTLEKHPTATAAARAFCKSLKLRQRPPAAEIDSMKRHYKNKGWVYPVKWGRKGRPIKIYDVYGGGGCEPKPKK